MYLFSLFYSLFSLFSFPFVYLSLDFSVMASKIFILYPLEKFVILSFDRNCCKIMKILLKKFHTFISVFIVKLEYRKTDAPTAILLLCPAGN